MMMTQGITSCKCFHRNRIGVQSTKRRAARIGLCLTGGILLLLLAVPVRAQDWDQKPTTGLSGPFGPEGPDGTCGSADDFDGINNLPDLRGPDGICGTVDDLQVYFWGTGKGGGRAGCFTNNTPNCVGDVGKKSAEWEIMQVVDIPNCQVITSVTNTSDGESDCPGRGCIAAWSSPRLPNLQAAVRAQIATPGGFPPGVTVSASDGPGPNVKCRIVQVHYNIGWNPTTDDEPVIILECCVPTVSQWGLIIMALLLVTVGKVVIVRRSKTRLA